MHSSSAKAFPPGLVQRARAFAALKHGDQRRKYSGEPYVVHLDAVVDVLRSHGIDTAAVLAAAYLHDTVEDTDTTIGEIVEHFGEGGELVYWLTDAEKGKRKMRKLMSAWRLGRAPWEAKLIKLADLIDNTDDICRKDRHFAPIYLGEKLKILEMMERADGEALTRLPLYRAAARIGTLGEYDRELTANTTVIPPEVHMTADAKSEKAPGTNRDKEPEDWVTGDETMTGAQASYLRTLCQEAGEEFHEGLTKAEASKRIDELQAKTGRGRDH